MKFLLRWIGPLFLTLSVLAQTTPVVQVDNWAALKALPVTVAGPKMSVLMKGRITANDGGGGIFFAVPGSVTPDDGGTVATFNAGGGAWFREYDHGYVNVLWFGPGPDGTSDNTATIKAAYDVISASGGTVFMPEASTNYVGNVTITNSNVRFVGGKGAGEGITSNAGIMIRPFVASSPVIRVANDTANVTGVSIENISFYGVTPGGTVAAGCLHFVGGSIENSARNCYFFDGTNTVMFVGGTNFESDLNRVISSRVRVGSLAASRGVEVIDARSINPAFKACNGTTLTDVHINGANSGYALELDQANVNANNLYMDYFTTHGVHITANGGAIRSGYTTFDGSGSFIKVESTSKNLSSYLDGDFSIVGSITFLDASTLTLTGFQHISGASSFALAEHASNLYLNDLTDPIGTLNLFDVNSGQARFTGNTDFLFNSTAVAVNNIGNGKKLIGLVFDNNEWHFQQTGVGGSSVLDINSIANGRKVDFSSPAGKIAYEVTVSDVSGANLVEITPAGSGVLAINGVSYVWPNAQGAANTVWVNDGAGNLTPTVLAGAPGSTLVGPLTVPFIPVATGTTNLGNSYLEQGSGYITTATNRAIIVGSTTNKLGGVFVGPLNASSNSISIYDSNDVFEGGFGPAGGLYSGPGTTQPGQPGVLKFSSPSLTADTPNVFWQTWNNAGITFHGLQVVITNTVSASASLPFQVLGGNSGTNALFGVTVGGVTILPNTGSQGAPTLRFSSSSTTGFFEANTTRWAFSSGGNSMMDFNSGGLLLKGGVGVFGWASGDPSNGSFQSGISQLSAGVMGFGTGAQGSVAGWFQWGGESRVSTQFDKTTDTTLANVTGLTATLIAGRTYNFRVHVDATLDTTGGGKYAMAGTCTATSINYRVRTDAASLARRSSARQTALGGTINATSTLTDDDIEIEGQITVNAAGTLTFQFAQSVSNGTSSILAGGYMMAWDAP